MAYAEKAIRRVNENVFVHDRSGFPEHIVVIWG